MERMECDVENRKFILLFLALNLFTALATADVKVFYIPLETQTYVPVTESDIENQAHYIFTSKNVDLTTIFSKI